jgi:hypothetical protein
MNGQALRDRPLDRASMTPFFTAFRTAFSIFLTALVCFLAVVQSLRSEDDLQLGVAHGRFPFVACQPRTFRKADFWVGL